MQDPIGVYERLLNYYISYLDTAFRIKDKSLTAERRRLLREFGKLSTAPLVEPIPRYENHKKGLEDLINDTEILSGFSKATRNLRECHRRMKYAGKDVEVAVALEGKVTAQAPLDSTLI